MIYIASDRATAGIDLLRGGRLSSLVLDGVELIGKAAPIGVGPAHWFDGCFPMAPYPGNVRDGTLSFEGRTYRLPPNNGLHAAHGLVDTVPWACTDVSAHAARLRADLASPWPFGGFVEQHFHITNSFLEVTLRCANEDRIMPAALGFHPWFRRDLGDGPAELDFQPRARFQPHAPGLFGELGSDLGERPWDDAFAGLRDHPGLRWPGGQQITVMSDAPVWMLYEQHPDGICIEPLTAAPDALLAGRAALVGPRSPLALTMRIDWSV